MMACVGGRSPGNCGPEMAALKLCLEQKRREMDQAIKEGRSLKTIKAVEMDCDS
jgi:hypothetical protein